jgi:HAE1 family hydrophobic/amphiphilic exporter-1
VKIADTSIRRPVFAVMLVASVVVLGLVSIPRLGVDLWPRVEFPIVTVQALLPGAAPETIENEVTQILEESINTVEGIRSLRSVSSDSLSLLVVEFELEYDAQDKAQQVRERVAAVAAELPAAVEPPVVERVDPDAQPVLAVLLAGPHSIRSLSEYADKRLKPRLERVPGVGSVGLVGGRPREMRVWLDPVRLAGYGLSVDDVLAALQREHVEAPGGRIEGQRREWALKTSGRLATAEEFAAVVVAERDGRVTHLEDVALVEDGLADERTLSRLDGRRGVALLVRRQSGENVVRVVDAVRAELELVRADLPPGYEIVVAQDASEFIRSSIREVVVALAWGALLASATVLLFLRNLRSTLVASVAIPTSLVGSFVFFYAFGFTINTMTLMALSLAVGLLIDDAIVVLENVYRHMEGGSPPRLAASEGTAEIGLAVVATTLAVCAVFVPIAFLSGVVGRFFREFGLAATCAIGVSALVAVTVTPMLCARTLRVSPARGALRRGWERRLAALEAAHRRALCWALAHRRAVAAIALAAVAAGGLLAARSPVNFMNQEDRSEFLVWLEMPLGTPLAGTRAALAEVEGALREIPEVETLFATVGAGSKRRVSDARIYVRLVHKRRRGATQAEVMERARARIEALALPLDDFAVEHLALIEVAGGRYADLMYSIRGPHLDRLHAHAEALIRRLREAGGYAELYSSYEVGKPEVSLEISRDRAAALGVSAEQIGRTISALYAGVEAITFEDGGERYPVRVQVRPEDRDDLSKLELASARARSGELVPLRNLVEPRIGLGPLEIERENRTRVVTIFGNLAGKPAAEADREVERLAREVGISGEYSIAAAGAAQRLRETGAAIRFAFGLALVAIYMILAAQFNSFVHPFTIMLSAPLSFIGAFAALRLHGGALDVMGQIAFLMLMGIVMKNGILLVDYTIALRRRGFARREAALEAGATRLRPVLMTAVSTVFGMLPVALGAGDGSEWRQPMGVVAIGGLTASTLLTLIAVPVAYTLMDDATSGALRAARAAAARLGVRRASGAGCARDGAPPARG